MHLAGAAAARAAIILTASQLPHGSEASERSAYSTGGGYGGVQMIAALSKRYRESWVGAFVKRDSLHGVAFADSPLVRDKQGVAAGFSIAWIFGESKTPVEVPR